MKYIFSKSAACLASMLVTSQAAYAQENDIPQPNASNWEVHGGIQAIQNRYSNGVKFNPLPEIHITGTHKTSDVKVTGLFDVNSRDGDLISDPEEVGLSVLALAAEIPFHDDKTNVSVGILPGEKVAAGGNLWWDTFPAAHPPLYGDGANIVNTEVLEHVGATIDTEIRKTDTSETRMRATVGARYTDINDKVGMPYSTYVRNENLGKKTSLSSDIKHTETLDKSSTILIGGGAGMLSATGDAQQDEYRAGIFSTFRHEIMPETRTVVSSEMTQFWNHNGQKGDEYTLTTVYGHVEHDINKDWTTYAAAAIDAHDFEDFVPSIESGVTFKITENTTIFASGGVQDGPQDTDYGTQIGARLSF